MQYSTRDLESMYNEMLDDCYEMIDICGYKYLPSTTLKTVDPIAYRCGFVDYLDSLVTDEIIFEHEDGSYHDEPESEDQLA
jgi:hypothetical protein